MSKVNDEYSAVHNSSQAYKQLLQEGRISQHMVRIFELFYLLPYLTTAPPWTQHEIKEANDIYTKITGIKMAKDSVHKVLRRMAVIGLISYEIDQRCPTEFSENNTEHIAGWGLVASFPDVKVVRQRLAAYERSLRRERVCKLILTNHVPARIIELVNQVTITDDQTDAAVGGLRDLATVCREYSFNDSLCSDLDKQRIAENKTAAEQDKLRQIAVKSGVIAEQARLYRVYRPDKPTKTWWEKQSELSKPDKKKKKKESEDE